VGTPPSARSSRLCTWRSAMTSSLTTEIARGLLQVGRALRGGHDDFGKAGIIRCRRCTCRSRSSIGRMSGARPASPTRKAAART
jgi:hypothetical protein